MTEVVEQPDPLVLRAFNSTDFARSARRVCQSLGVDESWISVIPDTFVLLIDEEGLWLCPEEAQSTPFISVGWPLVGKLRDTWGPRGGTGEAVAGAVVTMITLGALGVASRASGAVLCVPVRADAGPTEWMIPVDSVDGIAREADKRRPRRKRGPMLQWIPD